MSGKIIGTCGNCGGNVVMPVAFMSIYPPLPACVSCGSIPKAAKRSVIDMEPKPSAPSYAEAFGEIFK